MRDSFGRARDASGKVRDSSGKVRSWMYQLRDTGHHSSEKGLRLITTDKRCIPTLR